MASTTFSAGTTVASSWLNDVNTVTYKGMYNVLAFGVKGDGVTDDAPTLNSLGALGIPLYIPYTTTGYKINSTVTFSCNVVCDGTLNPATTIGSAVNDYDRFAVIIASAGYAIKRKITGIRIAGSVTLRSANVSGIRNDCENSLLENCHVFQLNYGIVARSYSQTYLKCNASQCNTNFDAYARDHSHEVNALSIIGGNYDTPVVRSLYIGDTTWSDAWGGSNLHGSVISISGCANFDGGEAKLNWCTAITIDTCYFETNPITNYGIVLGGTDNSVRNINIKNCFFKTLNIAIKCLAAVQGIKIDRNFYTSVTHCALYVVSDLYPYEYNSGDITSSFTLGKEVHTGFRFLAPSSINFNNVTIPHLGLYRGVQTMTQDVGEWYPMGQLKMALITQSDFSGDGFRHYTIPSTAIAGTVTIGGIFTPTTASDAAKFNGGDKVTLGVGGANFVRYVDYEAGIVYLDGASSAGATTLSQAAASTRKDGYASAIPVTGSYVKGDRLVNYLPTVGQPKAWVCTSTGTPGTWTSEGPL